MSELDSSFLSTEPVVGDIAPVLSPDEVIFTFYQEKLTRIYTEIIKKLDEFRRGLRATGDDESAVTDFEAKIKSWYNLITGEFENWKRKVDDTIETGKKEQKRVEVALSEIQLAHGNLQNLLDELQKERVINKQGTDIGTPLEVIRQLVNDTFDMRTQLQSLEVTKTLAGEVHSKLDMLTTKVADEFADLAQAPQKSEEERLGKTRDELTQKMKQIHEYFTYKSRDRKHKELYQQIAGYLRVTFDAYPKEAWSGDSVTIMEDLTQKIIAQVENDKRKAWLRRVSWKNLYYDFPKNHIINLRYTVDEYLRIMKSLPSSTNSGGNNGKK